MSHNPDRFPFMGSASEGTLRPEDLIPVFADLLADVLAYADPKGEQHEVHERLAAINIHLDVGVNPEGGDDEDTGDYISSDVADDDLEWLQDTLSEFAPPYTYFGASEGDGSDFGYWPSWDSIEEDRHFGDLPSGDELPEWVEGSSEWVEYDLFLVVSDHGNATLYRWRDGDWREVWGVV